MSDSLVVRGERPGRQPHPLLLVLSIVRNGTAWRTRERVGLTRVRAVNTVLVQILVSVGVAHPLVIAQPQENSGAIIMEIVVHLLHKLQQLVFVILRLRNVFLLNGVMLPGRI